MQPILTKLALVETEIAKLHTTLPHLPTEWRAFLVKVLPWLTVFGWVMSVITILGIFNLSVSPLARYYAAYGIWNIHMILILISSIVSAGVAFFAFPLLQKMAKLGWTYLFGGVLFSGIIAILTMTIGSVIGACIGIYLLFEVRNTYTK